MTSFREWTTEAITKYAFAIEDVENMETGEIVKLFLFDRNFSDYHRGSKGETYSIDRITLSHNTATYTHFKEMTGRFIIDHGSTVHDPFEWDLNVRRRYPECGFHPLCGGEIVGHGEPMKWTEFHKRTKIGWRGPCMRLDDVKHLPQEVTLYGDSRDWLPDFTLSDLTDL